jgi:hypothetical protein
MMTHTRIQQALVVASVAILFVPLGVAQDSRNFACPSSLVVTEQAAVPHGWSGSAAKTEHLFKTAKIYNGDPGKDEFDLKPDDQAKRSKNLILSWSLKDYRDMNLFVRCSYYDTSVTVTAYIPSTINKCYVTLELTSNNQIVGKSQMKCQ